MHTQPTMEECMSEAKWNKIRQGQMSHKNRMENKEQSNERQVEAIIRLKTIHEQGPH